MIFPAFLNKFLKLESPKSNHFSALEIFTNILAQEETFIDFSFLSYRRYMNLDQA